MDEMDQIGQELDRAMRLTITATGQVAERIARRNEDRGREIQRAAGEQARQLRDQLQGEMQAARLIYRPAVERAWWTNATERDAATVWQHAVGWSEHDPQAKAAAGIIREQAMHKWPGADVDQLLRRTDLAEDLGNAAADLESARHDRVDAAAREDLARELEDDALEAGDEEPARAEALAREAEGYQLDADRLEDHAATTERGAGPTTAGESGDRDQAYARTSERELAGVQSGAARTARLDSAPGFGRPAKEAVTTKGKTGAKARPARGRGAAKVRDTELGR
jgi:hypothetical protein